MSQLKSQYRRSSRQCNLQIKLPETHVSCLNTAEAVDNVIRNLNGEGEIILCRLNTAEAVDNVIGTPEFTASVKTSQYRRSSRQCNQDDYQ